MTKLFFFFFIIFSISCPLSLCSQTLSVTISGIRNASGSIQLQVYDNSKNFDAEKPLVSKIIAKATLLNGRLSCSINDLKPGNYGLALLDDENNNRKMDYGLLLPKEGFGFSDYYHSGLSRPKFEQFDFILEDKAVKSIAIKVRYM